MDVIEIDGASNRGIDEIRALRENARLRPASARYKIFYIDEVHMLTREAFNALLKTLEEPPPHVRFIMATTEEHKIPETVLSRCQVFRFRMLNSGEVVEQLRQIAKARGVEVEDPIYYAVARAGAGSMRDAISLFDQVLSLSDEKVSYEEAQLVLGTVDYGVLMDLAGKLHVGDVPGLLERVGQVATAGKDLLQFLRDLVEHYRALLVARNVKAPGELLPLSQEEIQEIAKQAAEIPESEILAAVETLWEAENRMRFLPDARTVLEVSLVKIAKIGRTVEIEELLHRLAGIEAAVQSGRSLRGPGRQESHTSGSVGPAPEAGRTVSTSGPGEKKAGSSSTQTGETKAEDERTDSGGGVAVACEAAGAAPAEAGNLLSRIQDHWTEIVDAAPPLLGGCLCWARPVGLEEGTLVLGVPPDHDFAIKRLTDEEGPAQTAQLIERVLGVRTRVVCRVIEGLSGTGPSDAGIAKALSFDAERLSQDIPNLANVLRMFNGKIVEVRQNGESQG
jgi:DNA polymerase-3 subunit gamma/tau